MEFIQNYIGYNSVVILTMFFISLIEVILNYATKGWVTQHIFSVERASLLNPLTYIRLVIHSLGHSDWGHFSRNYMKILLIGPLIEEKYGSVNLLIMIVITSLCVGIITFIKGKIRVCGASDITFMLIILSSIVNISDNKIPLTFILIIIFFMIDEVIYMFKKDTNVYHLGHLIGGICGAIFGFVCLETNLQEFLINLIE